MEHLLTHFPFVNKIHSPDLVCRGITCPLWMEVMRHPFGEPCVMHVSDSTWVRFGKF